MDYRQVVIDYVEGRIPFDDFYAQVNTDDAMATWIDQNVPSNWRCYTKATAENNYTPEELPYTIRGSMMMLARTDSVGSIGYRLNLQSAMASFLFESFPEITIHKDPSIEMTYDIAAKACPSYVDGKDVWSSGIIERFISECPDSSSNAQKVKYVKARIIEAFHLEDKKHPKWIQSPEWPFANGRPMKFVKTTVKHKNEWYQHHFVDLETSEERIVDDMY